MSEHCYKDHCHEKHGYCHCGCGCDHEQDHHSGECECMEKFLDIADKAWAEALKDKIKEKILAKKEDHLNKLAEIIAEANGAKWKHKIAAKVKVGEFKDDIKKLFSSCSE